MRPHASRHGETGRRRDSQRRAREALATGLAITLLLLALAAVGLPGLSFAIDAVQAAPLAGPSASASPTDTPTATPTATATPTPPPPTLRLVSPTPKQGQSSAQGPSGANVTISGANFSGPQVSIFASPQATCGTQLAALASIATTNGGFAAYSFVWPTTLPARQQYYICGAGMTAGAPGYYELTSAVPTLALSTADVQPGQVVTITGSNFLGPSSVDVTLQAGTTVHSIQSSVALSGNGSFSIQYVPDTSLTGEVQILAASPSENEAKPVLQASVFLNVLPASTATVGVTPTAQSTQAISKGVPPKTNTSDNTGLLVLIAAIVVGLLIVLGVVAFFMLRGRSGGSPAPGYPGGKAGPDGYGGGGYTGGVPAAYGGRQTGRPAGLDTEVDGAYGQALKVGAVAQWEDDPRPGPDWQPRPMSGRRPYEETPLPEYADDYPTDASRYAEAGGYDADDYRPEAAPPDPWADHDVADDLYGGRGATNPANYPEEEWTQVQPRRREPDPTDWHNEPGPGMTRPDHAAEDGARATERGTHTEDTKDTEVL